MAKPEFTPRTRLITTLGASGVGECIKLPIPVDGDVVITVASQRHCVTRRRRVHAGQLLSIKSESGWGNIYSWAVNYESEGDDG